VVLDTPLAAVSPDEPFAVTEPAAHAEGLPPLEQPANDIETMSSVATAALTDRYRHLLVCTDITSLVHSRP
jgi:hypothetical protein